MPVTRLTVADRDAIRTAMVAAAFDPREAALVAEEKALAFAVYNHVYDEKTRRWMEKAPPGALREDDDVQVQWAGNWERLRLGQNVRMFRKHSYGAFAVFEATHPIAERLDDLRRAKSSCEKEKREVERQVDAALASFTSFERALADWPEAETYIAARFEVVKGRKPMAPAVLLFDLNKTLGLPPATEEAAA